MKNGESIKSISQENLFPFLVSAVFRHVVFMFLGFLTTRAQILSYLSPFGLSLVGGVTNNYILSCAAGTVIGYLFGPAELSFFRYLVTSIGICAIRMLLNGAFKNTARPFFSAITVGLVTLSTGIVSAQSDTGEIVLSVAEAIMAASGAYFINRALTVIEKETVGLSREDLGSVVVSFSIIFSGLLSVQIADASLGRIIAVSVIMLASRFAGVLPGTVCGVVFGFVSLLCGADGSIAVLLALSGLMSGIFSSCGKYGVLVSFIVSVFVCTSLSSDEQMVLYLIESVLGAVIFLLIPKTVGIKIGKLLAPMPIIEPPEGLKRSVIMRLGYAANALGEVSETVENVAGELSKINAPDFSDVFDGVEELACRGCSLRVHCWESKRNDTVTAVIDMTKAIKNGSGEMLSFVSEEFKGRCLRSGKVADAVQKCYTQYASRIAAENRIEEVRGALSDQFGGIANLLNDLAGEIEEGEIFDNVAANNIIAALKNIDVLVDGCFCKIDKYGRMSVEIRIKNTKDKIINRMQIMRQVSLSCDRDFDAPCVTSFGDETLVNIIEKCTLRADIGVNQIVSSPHSMCGDSYKYFLDGKGRFLMVLSDGMGTGGRAAVDSAMASGLMGKLIKAGFGYDCALSILNSSMIFKSTDESLATVDIAAIDLYTGRCDLFKAGAAPTLVRRSGRTGKAQSTSLPAGILRDVSFDKATIRLHPGDILLLMSDGACNEGTEWICAEIESWDKGNAQELSEHISNCAKRRRSDNHEDDITVMAAIIEKAV